MTIVCGITLALVSIAFRTISITVTLVYTATVSSAHSRLSSIMNFMPEPAGFGTLDNKLERVPQAPQDWFPRYTVDLFLEV